MNQYKLTDRVLAYVRMYRVHCSCAHALHSLFVYANMAFTSTVRVLHLLRSQFVFGMRCVHCSCTHALSSLFIYARIGFIACVSHVLRSKFVFCIYCVHSSCLVCIAFTVRVRMH